MKKGKVKKTHKTCFKCKQSINEESDQYVEVITYNRVSTVNGKKLPTDYLFAHIDCWKTHFDERVREKAQNIVQEMQQKALKIMDAPFIQSVLSQVQGSESLMDMMKTPISHIVITKSKVKEKIENDRRKKGTDRQKTKV